MPNVFIPTEKPRWKRRMSAYGRFCTLSLSFLADTGTDAQNIAATNAATNAILPARPDVFLFSLIDLLTPPETLYCRPEQKNGLPVNEC